MKKLLLAILVLSVTSICYAADGEEEITLTTYYPAPLGDYNQFRTNVLAVGSGANMPTVDGIANFDLIANDPIAADSRKGDIYYNTTSGFRYYDGAGWQPLGGSGTGYWTLDSLNNYLYTNDATYSVGIGTTSPTGVLDVHGNNRSIILHAGRGIVGGNNGAGVTIAAAGSGTGGGTGGSVFITSGFAGGGGGATAGDIVLASGLENPLSGLGGGNIIFKTKDYIGAGGGAAIEQMRITQEGDVGIGTTSPTAKLHVIGKAIITGGVDPPYISFSDESHESIRQFARNVEKHEKVMQFWNGKTHRTEIYVIEEDKFYTISGELIEEYDK